MNVAEVLSCDEMVGGSKHPNGSIALTLDMSAVKPCVTEALGNVQCRSFTLGGNSNEGKLEVSCLSNGYQAQSLLVI